MSDHRHALKTPSRFENDPAPRRDFLGIAAVASAAATLLVALAGMMRLPRAAVLASPSRKFKVTIPDNQPLDEPFVPDGRSVALYKDADGIYAISTVCTHLGCIVKPSAAGFECPCHGSKFGADGAVVRGPAPKALPWKKVTVSGDGIIVDEDGDVPTGTKVSV